MASGKLNQVNSGTPAILAAHNLSLSNSANLTLLNSQIGSAAPQSGRLFAAICHLPADFGADQCSAALSPVREHRPRLTRLETPGMTPCR